MKIKNEINQQFSRIDDIGQLEPNESNLRLRDFVIVLDIIIETRRGARGARKRVADRHDVCSSTLTELVRRVEAAMGVRLFVSDADLPALTPEGNHFGVYGLEFIQSYHALRRLLRIRTSN